MNDTGLFAGDRWLIDGDEVTAYEFSVWARGQSKVVDDLRAGIERLREESTVRRNYTNALRDSNNGAVKLLAIANAKVKQLRRLVSGAGVVEDDPIFGYVTLQVDRDDWLAARAETEEGEE